MGSAFYFETKINRSNFSRNIVTVLKWSRPCKTISSTHIYYNYFLRKNAFSFLISFPPAAGLVLLIAVVFEILMCKVLKLNFAPIFYIASLQGMFTIVTNITNSENSDEFTVYSYLISYQAFCILSQVCCSPLQQTFVLI